ncbi:pyrroline-5-carboxylate reductase [Brachybacterium sp. EF45031]|uniref:pyrroline-5-carboxylate reductase n=1 Tax=Brachybacterium sillae TaxID=2810536 RepID=UPI00217DB877|nr:pyrroline-5-carboxylate reductase [Brachybacterium sillae]MCS6711323.1 pyrroline-5-carboxylate reductase [Brachybacterium sillae]
MPETDATPTAATPTEPTPTETTALLSSVTVVVLGAGNMGGAFLRAARAAGLPAERAVVVNRSEESSRRAADALEATAGTWDDIARADVLVLGVKPYQLDTVLPQVAERLAAGTHVVSLAAGATLAFLKEGLGGHAALTRAMPNTPMAIGEGVTALMHTDGVSAEQRERLEALLSASGVVEEIPEGQVHAIIGAAGSAPAFFFAVMEAMVDEAVRQGLPRELAARAVAQSARGAGSLMLERGEHPAVLRAAISSPGGTTAEGVAALERAGVRPGIAAAMEAAARRSREMAGE